MHQTAIIIIIIIYTELYRTRYTVLSLDDLYLCGDVRSDSAGFSAKYTSYTLMDMEMTLIVEQQLMQKNEVNNNSCLRTCITKPSFGL